MTNTAKFIFKAVFFCVFIIILLSGAYLTNRAKSTSYMNSSQVDYIDKWLVVDSSGKSFETGRTYNDNRAYSEDFTIISKLPDNIVLDRILCFQNRSSVKVYIDGKLRKSFDKFKDTGIPGGSMKEFYMTVPLSPDDSGAEVKIVKSRTDWNPMVVSETFVTSSDGFYSYMTAKYGTSFALTIVLFVSAILAALIGIFIHIWNKHTVDMLYGALGILVVAFWLLSVSQLTPVITGVYFADGMMGFFFCMMMPLSLLIYFNSIQKNRYGKLHRILFIITIINMIFWSAIHFCGIRSFQSSLVFIDSVLGLIVLFVIATLIADIINGHIKDYIFTATGFLIFMVLCIVEIILLIFTESDSDQIAMIIGLISLLAMIVIQQVDDIKKTKSRLEQEVTKRKAENEQMLIHIVQTLAGTIDAKDTYTKGHSGRVADYSREIARRFGYSNSQLNDIYIMGLLHDIGKIGVPDAVINKPGKLTNEEYEIIKKHPVMGAKILSNITEKEELATGARWHHEKYGGGGYPDGIKGEDIPEQARIIAVADAYDAMTSYRSYRDPMEQSKVRSEIEKGSGTQFDPRFAKIMLEMIAEDKDYKLRENKQE